jgi:hypothetical protein
MPQTNSQSLAPVAVYTYSRYEHLVQTLEALRQNHLASKTVLYVVSDGAKVAAHAPIVRRIRDYVDDLTGFREVVRVYRESNYGLNRSLPEAEQMILSDHGQIINMEDDNITSANYLDFLNAGLQHFEMDNSVYSVCGYCPPVGPSKAIANGDYWRYAWNMSWGYGVWKAKHDRFHPLKNRYPEMRRNGLLAKQNSAGGLYVSDSLKRDHRGLKYFPDAVLCTDMFAANMQAIIPTVSKVHNTGQDGSGQSTKQTTNKYDVVLDTGEQRAFDFTQESMEADEYRNGARGFFNGSAATRLARSLGIYHELSAWHERWSSGRAR